jgi:hypothetical protein
MDLQADNAIALARSSHEIGLPWAGLVAFLF